MTEGEAEVVEVGIDAARPFGFIRAGHPECGSLGEVDEPAQMSGVDGLRSTFVVQSLSAELAQRLQQSVPSRLQVH